MNAMTSTAKRRFASVTPPSLGIQLQAHEVQEDNRTANPEEGDEASSQQVHLEVSTDGHEVRVHRRSLFEAPSREALKAARHAGSSITSFSHEPPRFDEDTPRLKRVQYENTFCLEPSRKFLPDKVNRIIYEVLRAQLQDKTYEPHTCSVLCKSLSQEIKLRAQELDFKRYKLISTVTLGQKQDSSVRQVSRCLWDHDRDNFALATFENAHLFAVGVLYAVFFG